MNQKRKELTKGILAAALTGVLALTGCQESLGLETDDITISNYKEVEIEEVEKPEEVTEEDVVSYIDEERMEAAVDEEVDRAAEEGDTVDIDYVGYMNGEELDNASEEGCELVIGADTFIDGFEDSIIGHKAGDTYDWNGKFPDDYGEESVAGKDVTFTITLNKVMEENVPELDDEFAQSMSETATTSEEYQEEVKKYLEERNEIDYQLDVAEAAWAVVMDNTEVKQYPEGSVQAEVDHINEQYEQIAEMNGLDLETMMTSYFGYSSIDDYNTDVQEAAEQSVKQSLAVDAIADKENLTMDDETYQQMLEDIVTYYGYGDVETLEESEDEETLQETAKLFMVEEWVGDRCVQVASY